MIEEPTQPDLDPAEEGATEDPAEVEGHKKRHRTGLAEDTDDAPDFEGHLKRGMPAAAQRKR